MQKLVKKQENHLRISHESEVLVLRRTLVLLQAEMMELKKSMNANAISATDRKIVLASNRQHHFISLDQIIYCAADGNYTRVFIQQENKFPVEGNISPASPMSMLISKTLKSITCLISSSEFIRCHQSFLVNKKHVMGYAYKEGLQLTMSDDKRIPVSRRNKRVVLDLF